MKKMSFVEEEIAACVCSSPPPLYPRPPPPSSSSYEVAFSGSLWVLMCARCITAPGNPKPGRLDFRTARRVCVSDRNFRRRAARAGPLSSHH